jgi:hypothetical protein
MNKPKAIRKSWIIGAFLGALLLGLGIGWSVWYVSIFPFTRLEEDPGFKLPKDTVLLYLRREPTGFPPELGPPPAGGSETLSPMEKRRS